MRISACTGRGCMRAGSIVLATILLSACATGSGGTAPQSVQEAIRYSVGPCFGTCPIYSAEITLSGIARYEGERHVAVAGIRERDAGPQTYRTVAEMLAPFRPATGETAELACDHRITDQSTYRIEWHAADGTRTVLTHNLGCVSQRGRSLNAVLNRLPATLGIAEWIRPTAM